MIVPSPVANSGKRALYTLIPGQVAIELLAYYPDFLDYYPTCELQTKRWFVENVQPDWAIFDIGANIGYYSILFSRLAPRGSILAFEPTTTIDLLRANLAHHSCTNVEALQLAVGRRSGRIQDGIYRIWGQEPERQDYQFTTVDDLVLSRGVSRIDCLKIDVDSFDFDALLGAARTLERFDPWVVVELNDALAKRGQSAPQALEWLAAMGYSEARVLDHKNFVLKRSAAKPSDAGQASCRLIFDTRPLLMERDLESGRPITDAFESEPVVHNEARAESARTGGWLISAPGPTWSYAASWQRCENSDWPEGPIIIAIEISVSGGAIGVGCVNKDFSAYIGNETILLPTGSPETVTMRLEESTAINHLMLRNADPEGATGTALLTSIRCNRAIPTSARADEPLFDPTRRGMALSECQAALDGRPQAFAQQPPAVADIDIVPLEEIGTPLGFRRPFVPEILLYRHALANFQTERDESAIYRYIYTNAQPVRHFEFGTWEGFNVVLCAQSSGAEIWTLNLPHGELDASGRPVYASTEVGRQLSGSSGDSGAAIGWRYREAGYANRVHQILCDSRQFDDSAFPAGWFDTMLIDGGHQSDVVANDTRIALRLVRRGGIIIWHDFCPDTKALSLAAAPRGVMSAVLDNFASWRSNLSRLFWVRPSWMLIGIRA
jgi:FkbM family methyltransferase